MKNKLMNTSHFYERSALEVSDPVPRAFPCHKGKPFEGVSHVVWLLWIIDISRRPWILLISAPNAFDWFFPPPDQWTSSAGGGPPEMWPLLASPRAPKDTSPQGNLVWLLRGKSLKTSRSCYLTLAVWQIALGTGKGIADPVRLISSLSQQGVRFIKV